MSVIRNVHNTRWSAVKWLKSNQIKVLKVMKQDEERYNIAVFLLLRSKILLA